MRRILSLALICAVTLAGCGTIGSAISSAVVSTTTSTPSQVKTVAEAIQAAALVEKSLDLYVQSGAASQPVLQELKVLVPAVHNALVQAENADKNGNSAGVAAGIALFNEALGAVNSYETLKGVTH